MDQVITVPTSQRVKTKLGPLLPLLSFVLIDLLILSLSRFMLSIWQSERVFTVNDYEQIFLGGLRIDFSALGYLFAPALLMVIIATLLHQTRLLRLPLKIYLVAGSLLLLFFELITPTFILEYDLRPNRLFIDYLIYPKEVFSMLFGGYKLEMVTTLLVLGLAGKSLVLAYNRLWRPAVKGTFWSQITLQLLLVCLLVLGARGTLGHRPINPALVAFSNDHLLNDLSLNSAYSVAFANKQLKNEMSSADYYGPMDTQTLLSEVRRTLQDSQADYGDPLAPTKTMHTSPFPQRKKNLVILLQESLGARYVGKLGGLPLTPNLDQLMDEGWNFTQMYATGTRSVRGIEAVVTGFTPTAARSVVKLGKSQQNFFTLAGFLAQQGYHTQFVYGGESHFDNMKSFFLGNGFQDIVEGADFDKVDFTGSWGASDEDLYDQADKEFTQLQEKGKPFFSLVFTSSNHSPFEYPDGKITPYDSPKQTRNNAAKYSDYALGQFIRKAKQSNYWKDTVFVVVADHDSRVHGSSLVPVRHFRIPAVIFGQDVPHKVENRLASQIDLGPTLLSFIGASGEHPMLGNDFTQPLKADQPRAMLQYDKNFAYLKAGKAIVFQPHKTPQTFLLDSENLVPTQTDARLTKEAHAYANFGSLAYEKGWYQP
ncbi:LTA synthase family protein [Photobacterium sp. TY1-4]|uniref:LTA synthase family protein n=1 Tax=Photobacterium sp. TY1-4 TaxID=2899122 RepID=UPI0021BEC2A5|nr:LTA synthase family protein [Photobacterium sp. TY1-4]UXI03690.1 LTA synthase family protein [Photobacterium sp. TY1-4]